MKHIFVFFLYLSYIKRDVIRKIEKKNVLWEHKKKKKVINY